MNTVTTRITVKVVTGETFRSGWLKETPEALEEIRYVLSSVSGMETFDINTARGRKVYINPAHIVYSYVETRSRAQ